MPTRRDFIASAASTGFLAALPAALPLDRPHLLHGGERPEMHEARARALDDTDLTWVARLRGKSRAVFDSPAAGEGGALFRAALWRQEVNKAFGTPIEEVTPVVVFRHFAIPLIMNDEFWDHLGIGHDLKWKDPATKKWTKVNPIASEQPGMPPDFKDINIPAFIKSGGIVLACGLAYGDIIQQYMDKDKVDRPEAEKRANAHIIPGVVMQPSGFFAVLKAQDEGCKYFLGS